MKNINKYLIALIFLSTTLYAQVGINKVSPAPGVMLDVNGGVIVQHPDTKINENTYYLYRDKTNNKIVRGQIPNNRPVYVIEYKINMYKDGSGYQDWIQYYNTKINADKYFAFIIESVLFDAVTGKPTFLGHNKAWGQYQEQNPIKQVSLQRNGNIWALAADYQSVDIAERSHPHYWKLKVIVIDNNYVNHINGGEYTMNTNAVGSASSSPITGTPYVFNTIRDSFTSKGAVGIGTDAPQTELDVNGKMAIKKTTSSGIRELYPLMLEANSKHLVAFPEQRPIGFITGKINCESRNPGWNDYIEDFNLGIPKKSGIVIPINTYLGNRFYDENIGKHGYATFYGLAHRIFGNNAYNAVENVQTERSSETNNWHFKADYYSANPVCGIFQNNRINKADECKGTYYWQVGLLFLSSNLAKDLGIYEDTMLSQNQSKNDPNNQLDIITYLLKK